MLRLIGMSGLLLLAVACAPAAAQNSPPADQAAPQADQGPPAADQGPPQADQTAAPSGKPTAKQLIASCRADAKAKGLTGEALRSAVDECVGAERPKVAERLECRQQGKAKGLAGDDLKSFVKTCMAQGPRPAGETAAAPADAPAGEAPPAGGKPTAKQLIASCRADARAKGLTGDALRSAVDQCVGAERPKVAERLECRQQGKAKGLAGDELKSFVKTCMAQGPQSEGQTAAAPADQGPPPANGGPADQGQQPGAGPADQGPPPAVATGEETPPAGAAPGGKPTAKQLIASCRADAKAKGLTGDALRSAVDQCVGAERPKVAERLECRQQGKAKGLAGDELKSFVKTCVAQGAQ